MKSVPLELLDDSEQETCMSSPLAAAAAAMVFVCFCAHRQSAGVRFTRHSLEALHL